MLYFCLLLLLSNADSLLFKVSWIFFVALVWCKRYLKFLITRSIGISIASMVNTRQMWKLNKIGRITQASTRENISVCLCVC